MVSVASFLVPLFLFSFNRIHLILWCLAQLSVRYTMITTELARLLTLGLYFFSGSEVNTNQNSMQNSEPVLVRENMHAKSQKREITQPAPGAGKRKLTPKTGNHATTQFSRATVQGNMHRRQQKEIIQPVLSAGK